ncbi:MAG TPA: DinB family protein [Candidatus Sulfomarinibacteraceae bacterium]|nr:DinB family protein [Candidatus Sulfomarinibacteraceae bacterium]
MTHPLVEQLRFARSEWGRALDGVSEEEAQRRFLPMNCISWMVGHMAWHEHFYWVHVAQGRNVAPHLEELVGNSRPASTPGLKEMWETWRKVTQAADDYLESLTSAELARHLRYGGKEVSQSVGTMLQRVIYHYWYHIGESQAVRQLLGHPDLPEFVGDIGSEAPYRPEEIRV